jgi:hypothetical protein
MKITSAGIQRHAVIILALTSFLLLSAFQAFAQEKSPASAQKGNDYAFSHDLNAETTTFDAVNPTTQVAGRITVTITGAIRGKRLGDGQSAGGSHVEGDQQASFSFVPSNPYSPTYSATVRRLEVAGDTTDDSISFDFPVKATGSDGSVQWFMLSEKITATADGVQITFEQVELPEKFIAQR